MSFSAFSQTSRNSKLTGVDKRFLLLLLATSYLLVAVATPTRLEMTPESAERTAGHTRPIQQQRQLHLRLQGLQRLRRSVGGGRVPCQAGRADLEGLFHSLSAQTLRPGQFLRPTTQGQAFFYPNNLTALFSDSRDSPILASSSESGHLRRGPLCPVDWVARVLPAGYYPPTVRVAQCRCQTCVGHSALGCRPLYTGVVVLRPDGCRRGMQLYEEQILSLQHACVCLQP